MRYCITICLFLAFLSNAAFAQYVGEPISLQADKRSDEIFDKLNERHDGLYDALGLAYQNNPTLRAARAGLLATQEQLSQAQSGFQPKVSANADVTHTDTDTEGTSFVTSDGTNTSKSASLNVEQPLFRGGSTIADVRRAKNTITAEELSLSSTEQGILYDAAVAYMDLLRDTAILELRKNNRDLVIKELERARDGFRVGELTRTDVSQSEARLADAEASVITAEGALRSSSAVYAQVVGVPSAGELAFPETALFLPETLPEALSYAQSNNRSVLQAKFVNAAAEDDVDKVFGELLPEVSALGSLSKVYDQSDFIEEQRQTSIGLSATIPLYQGGSTYSRVREAKKKANQRYLQILEAVDKAEQEAVSNWESLKASRAEIKARQTQIEAARIAREGVHYEAEFGERTTLDVLDAHQELLDAQVNLVTAQRNEVVAEFALARTLGLLVPQKLGFSTINP